MNIPSLPRRSFIRGSALGLLAAPVLERIAHARQILAEDIAGLQDRSLADLADQYSLDPKITYLNHASIGTIPLPVQKAHEAYLRTCEENPWLYMWSGVWEEPREEARRKVAASIGCSEGELVFNHNTTEGFNLLASGLELGAGDEVLFSSLNHIGASECWRHHGDRRGFSVRVFDFPLGESESMSKERLIELHADAIRPETRVLVIPHMDNMVGLRHPLPEISAMAREKGVEYIAVDGAQAVGMLPLDLDASGVDFYGSSPHKWLQVPKGLGLLYIRENQQANLRPWQVTWGQSRWKGTVRVFEDYGTRNLPDLLTFSDAVDFHEGIGQARKAQRLEEIWRHCMQVVDSTPGLRWRSSREWELSCSLFAIEVEGHASAKVAEHMWEKHAVVFRAFGGELNSMRISPNFYTSEAEIDRFFEILKTELIG
ncbi:MAG: aminotransferase class V-fold PLP-dependent enzyme [Planctomycetota bacterium]|jgi:selenocysteine lyase/cysteine desulfurase